MEVIEVKDFRSEKQFLEVPFEIYRSDPNWICPPKVEIRSLFDPVKNPAWERGEAKRWILMKDGRLAGRIAAFFQVYPNRKEAGIGFFECGNDGSMSRDLFEVAVNWLQQKGFEEIDGPVNFGHRDAYWGLLVDGFEVPAFQDNYHPPYYRKLFEDFGFVPAYEQVTARITRADFNATRLAPIAKRIMANPAYSFLPFLMDETKKMARDFVEIYNQAWVHLEHFVPVEVEEMEKIIREMKPLVLADLISFAYVEEKPAGFFISIRDINPLIRSFMGRFGWAQKLLLFWRLKTQKPRKLRSIVFGVIPAQQNKGLETGMIWAFYEAIQRHPSIEEVELSWVGDFNPRMLALLEGIGAKPWKKHITYRLKSPPTLALRRAKQTI